MNAPRIASDAVAVPESLEEQARIFNSLMFGRWAELYPQAVVTVCTSGVEVIEKTSKGGNLRPAFGGKGFGAAQTVSITDIESLVRAELAHLTDPTLSGYVSANVQTHPEVLTGGRGTDAAHSGFTALYLDVDVRRDDTLDSMSLPSGHRVGAKSMPLPTMTEAATLITRVSKVLGDGTAFRPTVIQQTSDEGLHAIWCCDTSLLIPAFAGNDPENITNRWTALTQGIAADMGVALDSVSKDMARVLRSPGQRRIKGSARSLAALTDKAFDELMSAVEAGDADAIARHAELQARPQLTEASQTRIIALRPTNLLTGEHVARLPIVEKRKRERSVESKRSETVETKSGADAYEQSAADLAVEAMDISVMAELLLDIDISGNRFRWCNSSSPTSGEFKDGLMFINSETMNADLGVQGVLSPTSLLRLACGDNAVARAVINHLGSLDDETARIEWVDSLELSPFDGEHCDLAEWQAVNRVAIEAAGVTTVVKTVESEVGGAEISATVTTAEARLVDLMTKRAPREEVGVFTITQSGWVREGDEHKGSWRVRFGGPNHGTHRLRTVKVVEGEGEDAAETETVEENRLSTAVMLRTGVSELLRTTEEEPTTYSVTVVSPIGRCVVDGLTHAQSIDIPNVLAAGNAGGTIPDQSGVRELRNFMLNVGVGSQTRSLSYARTGWSKDHGTLRYVLCSNSYDGERVDDNVHLDVTPDLAITRLSDTPATTEDFQRLPELIAEAKAFTAGAPSLAAAMLMVSIASPIRVEGPNPALWLNGITNSGKTRVSYLATMWAQGGRGAPWKRELVSMKGTSLRGPIQTARQYGDVVGLYDDIRLGGNDTQMSYKDQIQGAKDVIAACHDRSDRVVGGQSQRRRGGGRMYCSAIITAETTLEHEQSMVAKHISLAEVKQGRTVMFDKVVKRHEDGSPVLNPRGEQVTRYRGDAFNERWGALANRVFTSWIAHLHADIMNNAHGDLTVWAEQGEVRLQETMEKLPDGRTPAVVARLLSGWTQFREWVQAAHGVELPDFWDESLVLLKDAVDAVGEQTDVFNLINAIHGRLDTSTGHFVTGKKKAPEGIAAQCGWEESNGAFLTTAGRNDLIGFISDDGQWVVMNSAHVKVMFPNMTDKVANRVLESLVPEDAREGYGGKSSVHRKGFGAVVRGWCIPVSALELEFSKD